MTNYLILSLLVTLQVVGSVCLKRGMDQLGAVNPLIVPSLLQQIVSDPFIMVGVVSYAGTFLLLAAAVSRMDLSFVIPIAASTYALTTLCAWLILGETVSLTRWFGTFLVSLGVIVVGLSGGNSTSTKRIRRPTLR